ncbi:uncharacterized protein LOC131153008 isoform X2 [Malania oleifera]|uniref:uncharacterized protein LOC131153008 isoform X2 n=1 Tax=Malania oleifera TaxID=397392 RepID=UPI0025AEA6A0|nr:uncharacterized protein LOC131153008 isoform X2 [Malania oleifera]
MTSPARSLFNPVYKRFDSRTNDTAQAPGSVELSMSGLSAHETHIQDQMNSRKLKVHSSDIVWSGIAWICSKQLKHYPAFCRNGATIAVHSFVFIMAEEESHYIGYLEDMYEDKKGQKKVKVRWFHHNKEVKSIVSQLNPHPREVFVTPHVQVISAECVDGLATVLTPKHYEKCLALVPHSLASGIHMCFRQFRNCKVKPFTLTKLRGYSNQEILSCLDNAVVSKHELKCHQVHGEEEDQTTHGDLMREGATWNSSCGGNDTVCLGAAPEMQITKSEPACQSLKLRISRKPTGIQFVKPQPNYPLFLKVNDKIELLCQDSGIRGCWFRCKILRASQKNVKVQYEDVQDVEGSGNLEEWVPASKVASPDKLGMRCLGRLTIRPRPIDDSVGCNLDLGAPVDAWWSDGWWEGFVIGVDPSVDDNLQIYFPGEDMFLMIPRKNLRISRDWIGHRWVDIKAKPSVLSSIAKASNSVNTVLLDQFLTKSKLEVVEEDGQEQPGSTSSENVPEIETTGKLRKRCRTDEEDEVKNGSGAAAGAGDDDDKSNDYPSIFEAKGSPKLSN